MVSSNNWCFHLSEKIVGLLQHHLKTIYEYEATTPINPNYTYCHYFIHSDNKSAGEDNEKTQKEDRDNLFSSPDENQNQSSKQLKAIALEGAEVISFEDGRGKYYEVCPIHGAHNRVRRSFSGSANSTYRSGFRCSDGNDVKIEIVRQ